MQFLMYFAVLIGWSITPVVRSRLAMLVAPALITTLLFIFSLAQQLALGVLVVKVAGLASAVFTIILAFRSVKIRKSLFSTGIAFLSVFLLSFFSTHGRNYWAWDEFSHWGAQIEYLLAVGDLDRRGDILIFPDYIPGLSLWRYFSRTILVDFGVAAAYFSGWAVVFSCFIVALESLKTTRFFVAFLVLFFLFSAFFQSLLLTLYADPVQAALLMCGLVLARNARNALVISPIVILLILSKHVGLIFCLFIFLYYFLRKYLIDQRPAIAVIRDLAIPFSTVTTCFLAWKFYIDNHNLSIKVLNLKNISALNLREALTYISDEFLGMLANKFPHAPFHESLYQFSDKLNIGFGGAVIASLAISFVLISTTNRTWPEIKTDFCFVSIFVLFYISFLTFIRATTPWGGDVYSFSRYISVVLFAVATFLIPSFFEKLPWPHLLLATTVAALLGTTFSPRPEYLFSQHPYPPIIESDIIEQKAQKALSHMRTTDRLWYIFDEKNGLHHFMFKMKLIPFYVESHLSGYNIFYNSKGIDWPEKKYRLNEFSKRMCSVDILYVDDVPQFFWEDYSELFDKPKTGTLYRVKKLSENRCMAELVTD